MTKKKGPQIKTGKRKCAIARITLTEGTGNITVNGKSAADYFGARLSLHQKIASPLETTGLLGKYDVKATIIGGGKVGQAEALMYGIAKTLAGQNAANKTALKAVGLLTRDSRVKERKKYGLKKARKAFQFSKR